MEVELIGVIDETVELSKYFPEGAGEVYVNCKWISRINSAGIRLWARFFNSLRRKEIRLHFVNLSHMLVELNQLFGFISKGEIDSVQVPLFCKRCRKVWTTVVSLHKDNAKSLAHLQECACPSCDTVLVADVDPHYLNFLKMPRTIPSDPPARFNKKTQTLELSL